MGGGGANGVGDEVDSLLFRILLFNVNCEKVVVSH